MYSLFSLYQFAIGGGRNLQVWSAMKGEVDVAPSKSKVAVTTNGREKFTLLFLTAF